MIIGCMSAFDMGGPVNKAAYVTGTALLAEGNQYFMAGVSAACITPPLVIAFATLLFRKYFSQQDRNAGLVNLFSAPLILLKALSRSPQRNQSLSFRFDDRLFGFGNINIFIRSSSTCPARRIPCTSRCNRSLSMGAVDYHRIAYRCLLIRLYQNGHMKRERLIKHENSSFNQKEHIYLQETLSSQAEALTGWLRSHMNQEQPNKQAVIDGLAQREAESTTGFIDGFAIPHAN
ncbi:PTS sugar transporter subunit IIA [Bacillus licheniformis]|nr:PTS sugar transporter subunit IIA [Bacillus licheniformis]